MSNNRQQGFTLIELLVALAIGAMLLMGIGSSIAAITQAQNLTRDYEQIQETLRFTTSLISRSLRTAVELTNDMANDAATTNSQFSVERTAEAGRLACNGEEPDANFYETYFQPANTNQLACRVASTDIVNPNPSWATTEIIAYGISAIQLSCLIYYHEDPRMEDDYDPCAGVSHDEVVSIRVIISFDNTAFKRLNSYTDHIFTSTLRSHLRGCARYGLAAACEEAPNP